MEGEGGVGYFRSTEQFLRCRARSARCDEMAKESKAPGLS